MSPRHYGALLANNSNSAIVNGSDATPAGSSTNPDTQNQQQPSSGALPSALHTPEVALSEPLTSGTAALTSTTTSVTTPKGTTHPLTNGGASLGAAPGPATTTGKVTLPAAMSATTVATSATTPATTNNNNNNAAGSNNNNNTAAVKSCAGCGARIVDRFLLHAMDRYWHTGCLKCSCCQAQLGEIGTSCFTKAGMILCKNDYIRLFGSSGTCAACSQNIPAQEFVMRAQSNVYHVNCFTCVTCHQRLVPGDRYSIVNGNLICEQDYPKVLKGHTPLPITATGRPNHKVNNNNTNINNRNEAEMLTYY